MIQRSHKDAQKMKKKILDLDLDLYRNIISKNAYGKAKKNQGC